MHHYTTITKQFVPGGKITAQPAFGNGSATHADLVATDINDEVHFVLQPLHTYLFREGTLIVKRRRTGERGWMPNESRRDRRLARLKT